MTPEETIRREQVQHAAILTSVEESLRRLWASLGAYDEADVPRFILRAQPLYEAAATRMAGLVDATASQLAGHRPIGVAARIPDVISNPRPIPIDEVWRRPFIEHWQGLSNGRDWQTALDRAANRAATIGSQNVQMVAREAISEIVTVHLTEPEALVPVAEPDVEALRTIAREQARLNELRLTDPTADVDTQLDDLAEARQEALNASVEPRQIVGYRRVLTGRSCMFCAAAATRIYSRGDLMPLHAHCDCSVAPVLLGSDPAFDLNRQVLDNLKAQGKGYWKRRGFVDNDGNPLDPTDVPNALGSSVDHPEVGPVLAT